MALINVLHGTYLSSSLMYLASASGTSYASWPALKIIKALLRHRYTNMKHVSTDWLTDTLRDKKNEQRHKKPDIQTVG